MFWLIPAYITVVCFLVLAALKTAAAAKTVGIPPTMASCVTVAGLIYASCLIPGVFGLLYTITEYCVFIVLSVAVILLFSKSSFHSCPQGPAERDDDVYIALPELGLIGFGLLGAIPLLTYLMWRFPSSLLNPDMALGWDTVSYHLPGFIEFWQHHTLWSLEGPFQSYSFAFELIGNFLSQPFCTHWGLILANLFAITLLVNAITVAARNLVPLLPTKRVVNWLPCGVLAIGIWSSIYAGSIVNVGKNDIFMTACLLAALSFLLEIATSTDEYPVKQWGLIFLVSISVGLALATKPSALTFVPFFAIATWFAIKIRGHERCAFTHRSIMAAAIVLIVSVLLGGFWLARNLLIYGHLTPLVGAWKLSLMANLGNPALYELKEGSIAFSLGVSALLPGLFLIYHCRRRHHSALPLALVVSFHIVACGTFAITPHAVFHHDLNSTVWKLRLGMPLFVSAFLICSLTAVHLCAAVPPWGKLQKTAFSLSPWGTLQKTAFSLALIVPFMLALPLHWHTTQSTGLPGYDHVKGLPRTDVYTWVQNQQTPLRIYSAGLRPYGLYGRGWANTLFYDLQSTGLSPLESGQARIAAIVVNFRPDLILISVDPHDYSGEATKPNIVVWMRAQSDYFEEVYCDETVSGFRVRNSAVDHLKTAIPVGYELKMEIW